VVWWPSRRCRPSYSYLFCYSLTPV